MRDFWERCVKAKCFVIPVEAYSRYNENGNVDIRYSLGVKYVALPGDLIAVGPEFFVMVEEATTGHLFDTAYAALMDFERRKIGELKVADRRPKDCCNDTKNLRREDGDAGRYIEHCCVCGNKHYIMEVDQLKMGIIDAKVSLEC